MRFRLLRRRLTISAPRMAVRSAMPWPVRWAAVAIVLGFCSAIGLWAFEFGKDIAGLDKNAKVELQNLRQEVATLRSERDKTQSVANTAESLLTTERATQDALMAQTRKLEAENQSLRDDLGFFQTLMPLAGNSETLAIRGLQAEMQPGMQLKWQLLLVQAVKNAPEFRGTMEINLAGTQNGKPWLMALPGGPQTIALKQYRRIEGMLTLPAQALVKTVTVRILDGSTTRASQTVKLQ